MESQEQRDQLIGEFESNFLDFAIRRNPLNLAAEQETIKTIADIARGNRAYPANLNDLISAHNYYTAGRFMYHIIVQNDKNFGWTEKDELVRGYLTKEALAQPHNHGQWGFIRTKLCQPIGTPGIDSFIQYLHSIGITDELLVRNIGKQFHLAFWTRNDDNETVETYFANYIKPKLKGSSSVLGLKKRAGLSLIHISEPTRPY